VFKKLDKNTQRGKGAERWLAAASAKIRCDRYFSGLFELHLKKRLKI
jgi:hypothetical protein